jgi:N6-adenosine-specific RNA methylase IME4
MSTTLIKLGEIQRALAEAKTLDVVVNIRDRAVAAAEYVKAAKLGIPMVNDAMEIKLRAERKAGAMLAKMEKKANRHSRCDTLSQLGIERQQSSRWQRLASLPNNLFDQHIAAVREAEKELTTVAFLKLAARQPTNGNGMTHGSGKRADSLEDVAEHKFGTIYADPPWQYGNQRTRAATDNHYDTMTVDELCAMPIAPLAADKAHLHLWTTNSFLPDAFRVIAAWGFEYKSCFVWCKPQMGIGNYWRVSHEFLLLGVRGGVTFNDHSLMSWATFKRAKHSAKPEEIRGFIERASPGPYLELFGRSQRDGWTVFGNQVEPRLCG